MNIDIEEAERCSSGTCQPLSLTRLGWLRQPRSGYGGASGEFDGSPAERTRLRAFLDFSRRPVDRVRPAAVGTWDHNTISGSNNVPGGSGELRNDERAVLPVAVVELDYCTHSVLLSMLGVEISVVPERVVKVF
jgi:hypothetical protein